MHRRWLSLPLLSSCVSAFYPYTEGGDKDKRFVPYQKLAQEAEDGVVKVDIHKIERRNNAFPIVKSTPPTATNALAIDQDGSDYSYFSSFSFGSKAQMMYMLIDTGSANTWVFSSDCQSPSCSIHNTFGPPDSTSLKTTNSPWTLTYGTGQVEGIMGSDTVSFASYTVDLGFGLATNASNDFNNYPMDGILGLGRATSNQLGTPTVMETLHQQAKLSNKVVGVHLQRAADNTNDGEIMFGGIDTSKFSGVLAYTATSNVQSWEIPADDMVIDGTPLNFQGRSAIIDTGTTYILMPPADAQLFHSKIPGSVQSGETYTIPCNTNNKVEVKISGTLYSISPKDYVGKPSGNTCSSNIIGHQAFGQNEWILGDVFLKNVYAVFDFDQGQIGLGMPGSGGTLPTSSASSGTSATGSSAPTGTSTVTATSSSGSTITSSASHHSSTSTSRPSSSTSDGSPFSTGSGSHNVGTARENPGILLVSMLAFIIGMVI